MAFRFRLLFGTALLALTLQACGKSREVRPDEYNDTNLRGPKSTLLGNQGSLFTFGKDADKGNETGSGSSAGAGSGSGIAVNAYLWRAALDTLSFIPLVSADAFGGVIITDWYQPQASAGERFKATAYILGRQLRSDGVKVSIFRQVQQGGQWLDAPVAPSTVTEIENKILARARELRTTPGAS